MMKFFWVSLLTAAMIAVVLSRYQGMGKLHELKGKLREKWGDLTDDEIAQAEGKLENVVGRIKQKWGDLTDDEIAQAEGKIEKLVGKIQRKYGGTKKQVLLQLQAL